MRNKLVRIYGQRHLYFVTFSCYRRQRLLGRFRARNLFVTVLREVKDGAPPKCELAALQRNKPRLRKRA